MLNERKYRPIVHAVVSDFSTLARPLSKKHVGLVKPKKSSNMKKVISTPNAPAAIGPYSQAIEVGNMVFLSGQIPVNPATGDVVEGGIKEQTTQVFENIKAVLAEAGLTLDNVVKTTVFLADISMFVEMNEVYATYFSGAFPARSAFAVKQLPKGALVEIESIAVRG